jgi:hypothetical protein
MKKFTVILLALTFIVFAGCSSDSISKESKASNNPFNTKETAISSSVAATVNGEEIPLKDFERRLHKKLFVMRAKGESVPGNTKEEQQKHLQDTVMQELVDEKLFLSVAKAEGVLPTDQELKEVLDQIKSNFPSEKIFKETMLSRGLTEENIVNFNRVQIIKERLAAKLGSAEKANQYIIDLEKNAQVKVNQTIVTPLIQQEL